MEEHNSPSESTNTEITTENTTPEHAGDNNSENATQSDKHVSGYDQVEFTPEQQKRFDRIYGQVKAQDRKIQEYRTIASDQARAIEELTKSQIQVANRVVEQDFSRAEEEVRNSAQDAYDRGDSRAFLAASEKIAEIKAQKIIAQQMRAQTQYQQPQNPQSQQRPNSAYAAAEYANNSGGLSGDELSTVSSWQEERDHNGSPVRSWAKDTDPNFQNALIEARAVFNNPRFAGKSINEKLAEVDKRMGVTRQSPNQNVMGANLTTQKKPNRMSLSPEIEKLAIRTKFGGPKAKTDQDHIDAYRKQLEKVKSSPQRGASK